MSFLLALSLSTGICCGLWALIGAFFPANLVVWIGFAGCTAYFASGKHGLEGVKTAFISTYSGVASALIALFVTSLFPSIPPMAIIMTGVVSGTMCIQSVVKELWFIPGAFIGCFTSFGYLSSGANIMGSDLKTLLLSLACGTILALSCDKGGGFLFSLFGKKEEQ